MIRQATISDIPSLVDLARRFHAATPYGRYGFRFSEYRMQQMLEGQIASEESARVLIAEIDGRLAGVAGAVIAPPYMSEDNSAVELYWWVEPSARGRGVSTQLMTALEDWARASGCLALVMSSIQIEGSPADEIYENRGYRNIEKSWIKGL